jgi:hypothetical protein
MRTLCTHFFIKFPEKMHVLKMQYYLKEACTILNDKSCHRNQLQGRDLFIRLSYFDGMLYIAGIIYKAKYKYNG